MTDRRMNVLSVCSGLGTPELAWHALGWRPAIMAEIETFPREVLRQRFRARDARRSPLMTDAQFIWADEGYPPLLWGDFTSIKERFLKRLTRAGRPSLSLGDIDVLVGGTPCQSFSVAGLRGSLADDRGNLSLAFVRLANAIDNVRSRLGRPPSGSYGKTSPACSRHETMPSAPSWAEWSAVMPPSIRQGEADGGMQVWLLDPKDAPHGAFWTPNTSAWRNDGGASLSSLADILEGPDDGTDLTPYYRSPKACAGILRRAVKRGKTLPRHLHHALAAVAGREPTSMSGGGSSLISSEAIRETQATALEPSPSVSTRGGQRRIDAESETLIVGALLAQGNKTGGNRHPGTTVDTVDQLVAVAFGETQITSKANRSNPQPGDPAHPVAAGARPPSIAVHARQDPDSGEVTHPLDTDGTSIGIMANAAVRSLTPRECERLQGLPDDWTAIEVKRKRAADGPRYKGIGNGMARPVLAYIGERIAAVDAARHAPHTIHDSPLTASAMFRAEPQEEASEK